MWRSLFYRNPDKPLYCVHQKSAADRKRLRQLRVSSAINCVVYSSPLVLRASQSGLFFSGTKTVVVVDWWSDEWDLFYLFKCNIFIVCDGVVYRWTTFRAVSYQKGQKYRWSAHKNKTQLAAWVSQVIAALALSQKDNGEPVRLVALSNFWGYVSYCLWLRSNVSYTKYSRRLV
jgi:hypothetical protein